jgi:hypothetical protein
MCKSDNAHIYRHSRRSVTMHCRVCEHMQWTVTIYRIRQELSNRGAGFEASMLMTSTETRRGPKEEGRVSAQEPVEEEQEPRSDWLHTRQRIPAPREGSHGPHGVT